MKRGLGVTMKESVRKFRTKEKKLLQLYSLWHETHRDDVQRKCITLLGQIVAVNPSFSLRHGFQKAF